jgi:transcriptional regulator with XRE-family HTH domain
MENKMNFSSWLREKRVEAGLSQLQVAEKLGYTTCQFISNFERGKSMPAAESLKELAKLYKLNQDEFLKSFVDSQLEKYKSKLLKRLKVDLK